MTKGQALKKAKQLAGKKVVVREKLGSKMIGELYMNGFAFNVLAEGRTWFEAIEDLKGNTSKSSKGYTWWKKGKTVK